MLLHVAFQLGSIKCTYLEVQEAGMVSRTNEPGAGRRDSIKGLTSQLHSSRHVDSVGCDQLRIRHLGTELELLEPSLFFWFGEKRQQVLVS
jgi:hypothetical protein